MNRSAPLGFLLLAACAPSRAGNPLADPSVQSEHGTLEGHVRQRLDAGGYVYLELERTGGERAWLVTLAGPATREPDLTATLFARAERFHSARLSRDFAPLHFAAVSPQHPKDTP